MANFRRGLKPEFIDLLNKAYDNGGWWRDILNDNDLHIGIRDNYLNVYYQGNSLFLLTGSGGLSGHTHYKYLLDPTKKLKPIISANGTIETLKDVFIDHLDKKNLDLMKRASTVYAGEEKKGIQWILKNNPNIIDMEIALTQEAENQEGEEMADLEETGRPTAPHVDFAALQQFPEGIKLVFFEAKLFSNKELRAKGKQDPPVIGQIEEYKNLIEKHMADIEKSYRRICQNLYELHGILGRKKKIVQSVLQGGVSFTISSLPKLVIFGFDKDQKMGQVWRENHLIKLEENLGTDRVLLKGDPKKFTSGISF